MSQSRLKIAMLAAHSCPVGELGAKDTGGMSVYIREVGRELSKQGHIVDVYTRVHDPNDPIVDDLGEGARLIHVKAGQEAKINKLEVYSYLPEFTRNLEVFRYNSGLSYDVVFSHYWLSGLVGQALKERWRAPHAIMFHTLGAVKNAIGIGEADPTLRIEAEKRLIDSCQCVIAPTEKGREELVEYYGADPEKINIVPCGVNTELFRPVEQSAARQRLGLKDEKIIIFVGRLDPLKGIERLVEALQFLSRFSDLKLLVIGGDQSSRGEVEKLQQIAKDLGIEDKVSFPGTVIQSELRYYYSAADVCVVPSYYESFGLVALEALACGTPVVANDVGNAKNIILPGNTGYVVNGNSPEMLAEGIGKILKRPPRDTETSHNIRESVRRFGWKDIASEIADAFNSMVENKLTVIER
jgi:D-inositol-3-phosphate glycosyltransferase